MIVAINKYLQAYHMYRAEALSTPEVRRLDTMSRDALATLQKEFSFGVKRANGTLRLFWCTEKPHSMVHWASNRRTVGRPRTISTNVTESRMKTAVKTKAKKTNHQASFGGSILKANMEVEAAIQLAHDLDETGMPCVCIGVGLLGVLLDIVQTLHTRTKLCKVCKPDNCRLCRLGSSVHSAPTAHFFRKSMQQVCTKCAKCARVLHQVCIPTKVFSGEKLLLVKMQT
jgi:hypothetical protein